LASTSMRSGSSERSPSRKPIALGDDSLCFEFTGAESLMLRTLKKKNP